MFKESLNSNAVGFFRRYEGGNILPGEYVLTMLRAMLFSERTKVFLKGTGTVFTYLKERA